MEDSSIAKVRSARAGDKHALVDLVVRKKDQLYRIAWSYLQNEHEVNDALQETIVKAFHDIVSLRNPEYFYTWYIRILINTCKQNIRQKRNIIDIEEIRETAEASGSLQDEGIDLERGMKQLTQEHREVVYMHFMEDLPVRDIAEILNLPEGTVKSRIHYGICKLREYIGERKLKKHEVQ